ncbi:sensor histidine kinase [Ruminococcaceae bacterium OttesenSCG-928-L11]|nr:sensor histidine kinase [Ruminococcaceae bacterium OttesenSCG-928-L11]
MIRRPQLSFSSKLFVAMSLVAITVFIVLTLVNLKAASKYTEREIGSEIIFRLDSLRQTAEAKMGAAEMVLRATVLDTDLLFGGNEQEIHTLLYQVQNSNPGLIQTLYFYDGDTVYCSKPALFAVYGNECIEQALDREYNPYMSRGAPYSTHISRDTVPVFYAVRNPTRRDHVGWIAADIDMGSIIRHMQQHYQNDDMAFFFVADGQAVMNDPAIRPAGQTQALLFGKQITGEQSEALLRCVTESGAKATDTVPVAIQFEGAELQVIRRDIMDNLNIYVLHNGNRVHQAVRQLRRNAAGTIVIAFGSLLLVSYLLSYAITKPIRYLTLRMQTVKDDGILPEPLENRFSGEFQEMIDSYNTMSSTIRELVEHNKHIRQEKDLFEIKMLQSQIGPHFLYNTLMCISTLSKQKQTEKAANLIRAFTLMLAGTYDRTGDMVSLEKELETQHAYVDIMKARYDREIDLRIQAPDEFLAYPVPKLLLQPLVENAIYHGIIPKEQDGKILIRCSRNRDALRITVYDNGMGFVVPPHILEPSQGYNGSGKFNHIGLSNIQQRIKLYYGAKYGMRIYSNPGVGTVSVIDLPIEFS